MSTKSRKSQPKKPTKNQSEKPAEKKDDADPIDIEIRGMKIHDSGITLCECPPDSELAAMQQALAVLGRLPSDAQIRALEWLRKRCESTIAQNSGFNLRSIFTDH